MVSSFKTDLCYQVADRNGLSLSQFYALNPTVDCYNLVIGQRLCVSGASPAVTSAAVSFFFVTLLQVSRLPAPSATPLVGCSKTNVVNSFTTDLCYQVAARNGLTLPQFYALNPGVDCYNLVIGQKLCVSGSAPVVTAPAVRLFFVANGRYQERLLPPAPLQQVMAVRSSMW